MIKIAVASQDFKTVGGHAGQSRRWLVFGLDTGQPLRCLEHVQLSKEQVFHHWQDQGPHPLDGVTVMIAASAGEGFLNRMRRRGIEMVMTGEGDAETAVLQWAGQRVTPPKPRPIGQLLCKLHDLFSKHK